jgi:hypothetical protein
VQDQTTFTATAMIRRGVVYRGGGGGKTTLVSSPPSASGFSWVFGK